MTEHERNGLEPEEAKMRLLRDGANEIKASKKKNILIRFFQQFQDFMILILLAAAIISFIVSAWEGEVQYADSLMILLIVIMNAVLGLIQEAKAERSLEALKKLSAPYALVLRGGKRIQVPSREVVVGDVVCLQAGNYIPADLRLFESVNLKTDESALTGESKPVKKDLSGKQSDMAYAMTIVTAGHGRGIVTATGMNTESGKIATMIREEEEKATPLQLRLEKVGKILGVSALFICAFIFAVGLFQGKPPFHMFMTAVSLAVAAIPEGLPAIVTIMLSIGVQRMAKKRAVIRRLSAVETLGSATVICTDKTGTLTMNQLTVTEYAVPCIGTIPISQNTAERNKLLEAAVLCNNAGREGSGKTYGEPLELAMVTAAEQSGIVVERVRSQQQRIYEIPFDSKRKRMTTIHKGAKGQRVVIKGAFDYILPMCTHYLNGTGKEPLVQNVRNRLIRMQEEMAARALRVIAVIEKYTNSGYPAEADEHGFTFLGLIGMQDPPRAEAKDAVHLCSSAGIRPIMITGDHELTATAIAKAVGIPNSGTVINGEKLNKLTSTEWNQVVREYSVFARVSPEHKVHIVKALQENGEVVAMTGDGINDAPALKKADIGCAMGKSGTDVAKGASDMVLTDDNFATIVEAVREGRGIYDNIRKSIHFLLSSNIGEILTILVAVLCGLPSPLAAVQLLWVNLVTDSLPAIALGVEAPDPRNMHRPPISKKQSIFADGMGISILLEGVMIGILSLIAFIIGGQTMCFAVLSLSQLVHAYNMRSSGSVFRLGILTNHKMNLAFLIGVVLQVAVIMTLPLTTVFNTSPMGTSKWLVTAALSLVPLAVVEVQKRFHEGMIRI